MQADIWGANGNGSIGNDDKHDIFSVLALSIKFPVFGQMYQIYYPWSNVSAMRTVSV